MQKIKRQPQQHNLRSCPILAVPIHSLYQRLPLKFVSPSPPECNYQSETKIEPDLRLQQRTKLEREKARQAGLGVGVKSEKKATKTDSPYPSQSYSAMA